MKEELRVSELGDGKEVRCLGGWSAWLGLDRWTSLRWWEKDVRRKPWLLPTPEFWHGTLTDWLTWKMPVLKVSVLCVNILGDESRMFWWRQSLSWVLLVSVVLSQLLYVKYFRPMISILDELSWSDWLKGRWVLDFVYTVNLGPDFQKNLRKNPKFSVSFS